MAVPLKPQFYVTRPDGALVPLIAMDELPSTIKFQGVPTYLFADGVHGMKGVGIYDKRKQRHTIDQPKSVIQSVSNTTSRFVQMTAPHSRRAYGIEEQPPSARSTLSSTLPNTDNDKLAGGTAISLPKDYQNQTKPLPPWPELSDSCSDPIPRSKEYCSYWLRHGECDYAQQGCLYKHEMPLDKWKLQRLGLRDIPRWYREKHGLVSYHAHPESDQRKMQTPHTGREPYHLSPEMMGVTGENTSGTQKAMRRGKKRGGALFDYPGSTDKVSQTKSSSRSPSDASTTTSEEAKTRVEQRNGTKVLVSPASIPSAEVSSEWPKDVQRVLGNRWIGKLPGLDANENQERERQALAEKYKALIPHKKVVVTKHSTEVSAHITDDTDKDIQTIPDKSANMETPGYEERRINTLMHTERARGTPTPQRMIYASLSKPRQMLPSPIAGGKVELKQQPQTVDTNARGNPVHLDAVDRLEHGHVD